MFSAFRCRSVPRSRRSGGLRSLLRLFVELLEDRQLLATFTVTNTLDSGAGSLRQAILDANADAILDTIRFNIPGSGVQTIRPTSGVLFVGQPVIIDGTTQPGFAGTPLIELDGSLAGSVDGLAVAGGGSTIKGLVINNFNGNGISLFNGAGTRSACRTDDGILSSAPAVRERGARCEPPRK